MKRKKLVILVCLQKSNDRILFYAYKQYKIKTMKTKTIILASILSISSWIAFGQNIIQQHKNTEHCAFDELNYKLINNDPNFLEKLIENENNLQSFISSHTEKEKSVRTIPTVIHIIHLGEEVGSGTNISDEQIQSAFTSINNAYRNSGTWNSVEGYDTQIEFCLAVRDPQGNAHSGINRINGSTVNDYSANGLTTSATTSWTDNEIAVKALSKWPNTDYYNVWIVAGIDGNMGGNGKHGFAYMPGSPATIDGAVMLYNAFGTVGNLGSDNQNTTFIHESGHALSLYHTFQGDGSGNTCPGNTTTGQDSDGVSDTPPHKRTVSTCNLTGTNSCDGNSSNNLYMTNFMNYGHCTSKFTAGQSTRINASLSSSSRSSWIASNGCTPVVNSSGINEIVSNNEIIVYPNPTQGIIQLRVPSNNQSIHSVSIVDQVGQIVKTFDLVDKTTNQVIDLSELQVGTYLLKFENSNEYKRIVIMK